MTFQIIHRRLIGLKITKNAHFCTYAGAAQQVAQCPETCENTGVFAVRCTLYRFIHSTTMHKILLTLITLLLASSLYAAPASDASIEALMDASKTESTIDILHANIEQIMRSAIAQNSKGKPQSAEQRRAMDNFASKFADVIREEMSWAKLKPSYVQLYRETFAQEEVDGLMAFYKSPAGIAYLNKMPTVVQKSMALSQSQMQTLMPKMQAALEQAAADAKLTK